MARGPRELFEEARRRRVFQTTGVYVVAVWGLSQGAVQVAPALDLPVGIVRWILIGSVVLLPVVVVLAWRFDVSREGIVRDPGDQPTLGVADSDTLATMPTAMGGDEGSGAIIVRWADVNGPAAALFREAFFIGRGAECGVRFYDPLVSRKHVRVQPEAGGWTIEDLGSRNGTLLGEQRMTAPAAVGAECWLRVNEAGPSLRLEYVAPGPAYHAALMQFRDGPVVAHVRAPARELVPPPRPGPVRS